jgi:small neutral amino acid transporter SnatA (MarC family)
MTAVLLLALITASNPPRRRAALSVDATPIVALGAALTAALFVVGAAIATPLLDALDTTAPNLRIGVGLVVGLAGVHDLLRRPPSAGAALPGARAALVPVFFPVLARPDVALLALSTGADHGVAIASGGAVLAMGAVIGWHALANAMGERPVFRRVEAAAGRVLAAATVVAGVLLTVDGVFSI